jgi:hypothetical protein
VRTLWRGGVRRGPSPIAFTENGTDPGGHGHVWENAKQYLKEHPELAAAIAQQLRHTLRLPRVAAETPAGTAATSELWSLERDAGHA